MSNPDDLIRPGDVLPAPDVARLVAEIAAAAKGRAVDAPEWRDGDMIGIQVSVRSLRAALAAWGGSNG